MLLYLWKIFNSAKVRIEQNWWSSCVTSDALEISCLMSFFFLATVMLFSISCFNQWTRYVTVLLSSWCSTSIIIVAWILIKWWAHAKLSTEWTHAASFSDIFSSCCLLIWFLMNWCVQSGQFFFKFSCFCDNTWQIIHCWFILTPIINTCFS